jgi:hypothetical protein
MGGLASRCVYEQAGNSVNVQKGNHRDKRIHYGISLSGSFSCWQSRQLFTTCISVV